MRLFLTTRGAMKCSSWSALSSRAALLSPIRARRNHTLALARALPPSFASGALSRPRPRSAGDNTNIDNDGGGGGGGDGGDGVSMFKAVQQHESYLQTMRRYVPTLCLPSLPNHPDCAFVEDAVVTIRGRALLTRPGHDSRKGEVSSIRDVLGRLGVEVAGDMTRGFENCDVGPDERATCDGGDVLYTGLGRHLFVGMSSRSNQEACEHLERAFGDFVEGVIPVELPNPKSGGNEDPSDAESPSPLHLKSATTCLDPHTLLVPSGLCGDALIASLQVDRHGYDVIRLPSMLACNAVVINCKHVLAQGGACPESKQILVDAARQRDMTIDFVDTSELAKKDAALTCCSVLLEI